MKVLLAQANAAARGGAEAYAAALCKCLTDAGHSVGQVDVRGHMRADGSRQKLPFLVGRSLWNWAQVCRVLPGLAKYYEAVVLAYGEGPNLGCPTLTIRHAPVLFTDAPQLLAHLGSDGGLLRRSYAKVCRSVAGQITGKTLGHMDRTYANSRWTARIIARETDQICDGVLYPPLVRPHVGTSGPRAPFGLVTLGRIVPNKRTHEAIELADILRSRGLPVTLSIVGRGAGRYFENITQMAQVRPHVQIYTDASDAQLHSILSQATLGFHGYRGEHFGIAVAEMILAGVAPLVHDSGGVRELVTCNCLRYRDLDQAAVLAEKAFTRPDLRRSALDQMQNGQALSQALEFDRHAARVLDEWQAAILAGPAAHAAA